MYVLGHLDVGTAIDRFRRRDDPEPPRPRVFRTHTCGEPPDPYDDAGAPRVTVRFVDDRAGTRFWVDNERGMTTPAEVQLTPNAHHYVIVKTEGGWGGSTVMTTDEDGQVVCVARDQACDGR